MRIAVKCGFCFSEVTNPGSATAIIRCLCCGTEVIVPPTPKQLPPERNGKSLLDQSANETVPSGSDLFDVSCPWCGFPSRVPSREAGRKMMCECGRQFLIPLTVEYLEATPAIAATEPEREVPEPESEEYDDEPSLPRICRPARAQHKPIPTKNLVAFTLTVFSFMFIGIGLIRFLQPGWIIFLLIAGFCAVAALLVLFLGKKPKNRYRRRMHRR